MIVPTRTLQHSDGRVEIVRVLNTPALHDWSPEGCLSFEGSVMWLSPVAALDFVRVGVVYDAPRRTGRLSLGDQLIVVGYANLTSDAPPHPRTGGFVRRVFYWRPEDLSANMNCIPDGAIDPATLLPGYEGDFPDVRELNAGYLRHDRKTPVDEATMRARRAVALSRPLLCAG